MTTQRRKCNSGSQIRTHSDASISRFLDLFIYALVLLTISLVNPSSASSSTGSVANFVRSDTSTQGSWRGVYGSDGYSIANNSQNLPSYASFTVQNQSNYTWASSTTDSRALQTGSGTGRISSTWDSYSTFHFDVNLTDGNSHRFALYAVDWDYTTRAETIQIVDANTGAVLDTRDISAFHNGIYLVWNLSGHVKINVTRTGAVNAVVSGVFFGGSTGPFITQDASTQGNWRGVYGADGYSIANNSQSLPSYVSFTVQKQSNYTWASSTADSRALQTGSGTGRIAATWDSYSTFNFDVNLTDGNSHRFALYAVDWDYTTRAETIQIVDANSGAVLDTRSISTFHNGIYLVWNLSGHVKINVTRTGAVNAVISGVFFGGSAPLAPAIVSSIETLTGSASALNFGSVNIGSTSVLNATLTNSGSSNITVSNVVVSGPGFSASGVSTGAIVSPGQTVTLNASFAPAASGSASGSVSVVSNAGNSPASISLSGTGVQPTHSVTLAWTPSTSTAIGYNVYRGAFSNGPYIKINSSLDPSTTFTDTTVQAAQTYYWVVTAVSSSNQESAYSSDVSATIPTP